MDTRNIEIRNDRDGTYTVIEIDISECQYEVDVDVMATDTVSQWCSNNRISQSDVDWEYLYI